MMIPTEKAVTLVGAGTQGSRLAYMVRTNNLLVSLLSSSCVRKYD